jgi:hypothetical protein
MWHRIRTKALLASLVLTAASRVLAWSLNSDTHTAPPGTLNYLEGHAFVDNSALNKNAIGSTDLKAGQTLTTADGKVEVLLTPGVFLRVGENSSAQMITPDLTDTHLRLNQGQAMVEVDKIYPENDIQITQNGATARLLKNGLYDFDAEEGHMRVFSGKASVVDGDRTLTVKGGHELRLNTPNAKVVSFNKEEFAKTDDLYRWSSLRSEYLAEANVNTARIYVVDGWYGPGWIGAGWYWSPWYDCYSFIPGGGFLFSPFGWGFYSPLWAYRAPVYGYGAYYHHFGDFQPAGANRAGNLRPIYGPGFHGSNVRSFGTTPLHGGVARTPSMHAAVPFGGFHGGHLGGFQGTGPVQGRR